MKKVILEKFANFKVSRNISKEIKGGYGGPMDQCNGVGCPTSGGSCTYQGPCQLNGNPYSVYSCTQPSNAQQTIDSLRNSGYSGGTISSNTTTIICTGAPIV